MSSLYFVACSRLRDSGESVNWEKERGKKAKGLGRDPPPPPFFQIPRVLFSRSLSSFRVVPTIWEPGAGYLFCSYNSTLKARKCHNNRTSKEIIENKPGRISCYVLLQSPCESFPCQHGGTCHASYETNDYSCNCTEKYTGKHCESKQKLLFINVMSVI